MANNGLFCFKLGDTRFQSIDFQRLAHGLGMKVVAEGVETDEQLSLLKSLDCEFIQGFLFSEPIDGKDMENLLGKLLDY